MGQFGNDYFKLSPELLCVFDLDGNFIELNPSWNKTLGRNISEFLQTSFINFVHPDDKEISMDTFRKLISREIDTLTNFENRYLHFDGQYRWLQWSASLNEGDSQIFCIARDITTSKRDSLLFAQTQEVSLVGSWEIDLTTGELFWSQMCHQIHETDWTTFLPKLNDGLSFFGDTGKQIIKAHVDRLLVSGEGYDLELPFITAKGRQTWVRCVARANVRNGVVINVFGTIEDIGQKLIERKISMEREKIFETVVNNIPVMLTSYDKDGKVEWINPYWTETLGWSLEDLKRVDTMAAQLCLNEDDSRDAINFMIEAPKEWREYVLYKKDGSLSRTIWTNVKLNDGRTIGLGQDIGEKRMLEELIKDQQARMISSAKLSSLGEMASGIAHEINNPLAIIKGKAFQIMKKLESSEIDIEFLKKEISKIDQNTQRIVKIIKGLRTFSRQGENDPYQIVNFKSILDDVIELCNERFKNQSVELKMSGNQSVQINGQETQLAQVLLNLISNAHDAVSKDTNPWVEVHVEQNELAVTIYVTDSGKGISEVLAQKIMQPFFTTKDVGTGTGLGLSISKGIIEMHGGSLFLDRFCPNTRFVIQLPTKENFKTAIQKW